MLDTGQLPLDQTTLQVFRQGLACSAHQDYKQAIEIFNKVLQVRPDCGEAWYQRGFALEHLGAHAAAIASYEKALEQHLKSETTCEVWFRRGYVLQYGLGNYDAALRCYDRVLQIYPEHPQAWQSRGDVLLYGLSRYVEAVANYDRALLIAPQDPIIWRNRGNALIKLGRYPSAIASYNRALAIEPNDQATQYARDCAINQTLLFEKQPTTNPAWYGRGFSENNPMDSAEVAQLADLADVEADKLTVSSATAETVEPPPPPMLVVEDDAGRREIPLTQAVYTVGRDPGSDICLYSQFVSRQHAILLRLTQTESYYTYQIVDGNLQGKRSTNGLLINGQKQKVYNLTHEDGIIFAPNVKVTFLQLTSS